MNIRIYLISILWILILMFFAPSKANAGSLAGLKDTITTSRPSASATLQSDQAASATQVTINDLSDNIFFLASDSATLRPDTGETLNTVTVASASAGDTPSSNQRVVYFVGSAANTHHKGNVITSPITALHTVQFTVPNSIPSGGDILLTFPALTSGDANTPASPSATTFQFNNLADAQIEIWDDAGEISPTVTVTNPTAGTSPTIRFALAASVAANSVIKIYLGCTVSDSSSCTTQAPMMINPTKSAAAGTADRWKLKIQTMDGSDIEIDDATATIGTIDAVQVQATVDPTLTFTIAGIANNTAINNGNTTGCTNTEVTNTGIASTANTINLGVINTSAINISAQLITVSTNALNGYSLTATSSGHLIDPASGFWILDDNTLAGTSLTVGTPQFGIHACGLDISASDWGTGATGGGINAKYAWPLSTALTIASDSTGPVGDSITTGNGLTSVEYAATVNVSVPAGTYQSYITYVATPTF